MREKESISCMKRAIRIICIPSGQDRSSIEKGIVKNYFEISYRRICNQYMIPPEDRGMRFGVENDR